MTRVPEFVFRFLPVLALALSGATAQAQTASQAATATATAAAPKIGVFYYPGWKDNVPGMKARPWDDMAPYPEKKPLLGFYPEGDVDVMRQQLAWMNQFGINYIVFDWYWDGSKPWSDHALKAYLAAKDPRVKFSVMWPNHGKAPESGAFFYSMVRYWIDNYFKRPDYLTVDGKPVAFIMLGTELDAKAKAFGSSAAELIGRAQAMAKAAGLPGIFFASGGGGGWLLGGPGPEPMGFSAYFAYNYHAGPFGKIGQEARASRGYAELNAAYQEHWRWMMANANAPYILPLTSGWDKRPWGGSKDPLHDKSVATPAEFGKHLAAARAVMQANPAKTLGMAVICCWNEFGEGSFIEPTEQNGTRVLEEVKKVFAP
jgi:hypothetical protein